MYYKNWKKKHKLKEIDTENYTLYYFDNIIEIKDFGCMFLSCHVHVSESIHTL